MNAPTPVDDFPVESWLSVRVLDGDTPRAVRMRHWLKQGLRSFGIKAIRLTGELPAVEREIGPESGQIPPATANGRNG
jgi:hypothetical protein